MAEKNSTLRGLIQGAVYDLLPKTNIYNVWVDSQTTLAAKLAEVITSLNGKVTQDQLATAIKEALADFDGGVSPEQVVEAIESAILENGIIKRELLPEGYPYTGFTEIFPEQSLAFTEEFDYQAPLLHPIGLVAGGTYKVSWNGTVYSCVAESAEIEGVPVVIMGDLGAIGGEPTGTHPFGVMELPPDMAAEMGGVYGVIMPLDGSESAVVSIRVGGNIPIDKKLLPEGYPYVIEGGTTVLEETTLTDSDGGAFTLPASLNTSATYKVTWNGTDYIVSPVSFANNSYSGVYWGDGSSFSGEPSEEPFTIAAISGMVQMVMANDGSAAPTIKIVTEKSYVPMSEKYLPTGGLRLVNGTNRGSMRSADSKEEDDTYKVGNYSFVVGDDAQADGSHSVALGHGANATGEESVAIGRGCVAKFADQHVFGKYNDYEDANNFKNTFVVGVGDGDSSRVNGFTVDYVGRGWFRKGLKVGGESSSDSDSRSVLTTGDRTPNPRAITFTGEVTGTYDGSAAKTVNIPKAVRYEAQTLTEAQKTQARTNMGLDSAITYDTFPAEDVVNAMADWTVFKTRGFYSKDDGLAGAYVVKSSSGSLYVPYGSKYIAPYKNTALVDRDIYVDQYGVRRGDASYAARNSEILTSLMSVMQNGYTLHFGSGQYYFSDPIACDSKYITLKGVCTNACMPGTDVNIGTYLHFPDLADGEAAITFAGGAVQDLGIVGNPSICDVNLDRTKTLTDPSTVVTLVDTGTTYGIKPGTWGYTIQNVRVKNFTYGIYSETGNFLIDGITARQCKVGISVGNDVKITNVQLWNVMTGIELRGALASATNIRGDSIGKHLIHCWNGKANLVNIDGDYCVGSLIHYGGGTATYIHLGQAVACMGRVATKNVYSRDATFDLRTLSDADYEYCSYISIAPNTRVFGGHIELVNVSANPMDSSSGYVHPNAPISIGTGSTVKGVTIRCNIPYDADTEYFNRCVIKNLSTYAEASNDGTSYVTDFDGQTIEDIVFITPIGLVRSRRTSAALDRTLEFDSEVKTKVSEVISAQEVLVPGINLNDGVYEYGRFATEGTEYNSDSPITIAFRSTNYLPVEGGRSITSYHDKAEWNKNDQGICPYVVQYDKDKNILVARTEIPTFINNSTGLTLNANTAFIRVSFVKWSAITTPLTDIKMAVYYIEDAVKEFVEYGYDVEQTYGVMGEKVFLTSPNGAKFVLSVSDSGVLSVAPLNPT